MTWQRWESFVLHASNTASRILADLHKPVLVLKCMLHCQVNSEIQFRIFILCICHTAHQWFPQHILYCMWIVYLFSVAYKLFKLSNRTDAYSLFSIVWNPNWNWCSPESWSWNCPISSWFKPSLESTISYFLRHPICFWCIFPEFLSQVLYLDEPGIHCLQAKPNLETDAKIPSLWLKQHKAPLDRVFYTVSLHCSSVSTLKSSTCSVGAINREIWGLLHQMYSVNLSRLSTGIARYCCGVKIMMDIQVHVIHFWLGYKSCTSCSERLFFKKLFLFFKEYSLL